MHRPAVAKPLTGLLAALSLTLGIIGFLLPPPRARGRRKMAGGIRMHY